MSNENDRSGSFYSAVSKSLHAHLKFSRCTFELKKVQIGELEAILTVTHQLSLRFEWDRICYAGPALRREGSIGGYTKANLERLHLESTKLLSETPVSCVEWSFGSKNMWGFAKTGAVQLGRFKRHVESEQQCSICCGNGKIRCGGCGAHGRIRCVSCNGSGRKLCYGCGGQGRVQSGASRGPCGSCAGYGRVHCHGCISRGWNYCNSCSGSGQKNCRDCSASGVLHRLGRFVVASEVSSNRKIAGHPKFSSAKLLEIPWPDLGHLTVSNKGWNLVSNENAAVKFRLNGLIPFNFGLVTINRADSDHEIWMLGPNKDFYPTKTLLSTLEALDREGAFRSIPTIASLMSFSRQTTTKAIVNKLGSSLPGKYIEENHLSILGASPARSDYSDAASRLARVLRFRQTAISALCIVFVFTLGWSLNEALFLYDLHWPRLLHLSWYSGLDLYLLGVLMYCCFWQDTESLGNMMPTFTKRYGKPWFLVTVPLLAAFAWFVSPNARGIAMGQLPPLFEALPVLFTDVLGFVKSLADSLIT